MQVGVCLDLGSRQHTSLCENKEEMVKIKNEGNYDGLKSKEILQDQWTKIKLEIITGIDSSLIEIITDLGLFVHFGLFVMESKNMLLVAPR